MPAKKLFGTDGIRGAAGEYPLDPPTVERLGWALSQALPRRGEPQRFLIGRDPRESGPEIEAALIRGLIAGGARVKSSGVLTTPAIAFLTKTGKFDAGIVISASHNHFSDNGIKVFSRYGFKLSDAYEERVESLMRANVKAPEIGNGDAAVYPSGTDPLLKTRYVGALRSAVPADFSLDGQRLVLDCANGAASAFAPELFRSLGADVQAIGCTPDGRNINEGSGATDTAALVEAVKSTPGAIGIAYDGDADRCLLVDEEGAICDGDDILAIAVTSLTSRGVRVGDVVSTVMANLGLEQYIRSLGLVFARTDVGDKAVLTEMLLRDAMIGGEQSGHIIFLAHSTTGDGILTSLLLTQMIQQSGRSLRELASCWTRLPQTLVNVKVREKVDLDGVPEIAGEIHEIESKLAKRGRLLVRYSGTEPLLRIMLEGDDAEEIETLAAGLAETVKKKIG